MKVNVCVLFKLINVKHNVLIVDVFVEKKWIIEIKIKMRTIKKQIKSLKKINYIVVILIVIKHNLKLSFKVKEENKSVKRYESE